jgi:hypothetical protein
MNLRSDSFPCGRISVKIYHYNLNVKTLYVVRAVVYKVKRGKIKRHINLMPQQKSNLRLRLRRATLYPPNYGGGR